MATISYHHTLCTSFSLDRNNPSKTKKTRNLKPRLGTPKSTFTNRKKDKIQLNTILLTRTLCDFINSGHLDKAQSLFEEMLERDTFVWNCMIRGYTNNALYDQAIEFYQTMQSLGVKADTYTFPFVIKSCIGMSSLTLGWKAHGKVIKIGFDRDVFICNSLIVMYAKLGSVECAERVFDEMPVRDLVSWNSMMSGYVSAGNGWKALICFREMLGEGLESDRFGVVSALLGCSLEGCGEYGKGIHAYVVKFALDFDIMVQTSLIDMYGKCGVIDIAEKLFNRMSCRNIVVWNAMIGGYALNGKALEAFACLERMQKRGDMAPDEITVVNLLPACAQLRGLLPGKSIHCYAIRKGYIPHLVLETALVDVYGKCGEVKLAKALFDNMVEKSLSSWNALLAAYVENGWNWKAIGLFCKMFSGSMRIDSVTVATILPAYAEVALLRDGAQVHCYILKLDFDLNTSISNAVVYMYAKCGDITRARQVFDRMLYKDVVSWNTIIMGYAVHGYGREAVELFRKMQEENVKPNKSTFVSVLSSCSLTGLVDEGWEYFRSMRTKYCIEPGIEHYGCMVDLLGRSGALNEARRFIEEMPLVPTARIWGSLLTASRNNGNIESAEYAARYILSLAHDNTGCYILLFNMYAEAGRWEDVERIRSLMTKEGLTRTIGCSTVEMDSKAYRFVNGDDSHAQTNLIFNVVDNVADHIGENILVPNIFKPVDLINKTWRSPRYHSVRLAVCFCLISTTVGSPILVRKNVRICNGCHNALKLMSKTTRREITVGDSSLYHHFRNGHCSCGDYW